MLPFLDVLSKHGLCLNNGFHCFLPKIFTENFHNSFRWIFFPPCVQMKASQLALNVGYKSDPKLNFCKTLFNVFGSVWSAHVSHPIATHKSNCDANLLSERLIIVFHFKQQVFALKMTNINGCMENTAFLLV